MLSFIAAMDRNNVIGYQKGMPWYLPNDFKFFKETTTGHTMIMGRKTFESIGRVLPNRKHVILTSKNNGFPEEVEIIHDVQTIIDRYKYINEEVFVIGGGHLFKELMDKADKLYVTRIDETFQGDVYFPEIRPEEWKETKCAKGLKDEKNPYDYYFLEFERK